MEPRRFGLILFGRFLRRRRQKTISRSFLVDYDASGTQVESNRQPTARGAGKVDLLSACQRDSHEKLKSKILRIYQIQ